MLRPTERFALNDADVAAEMIDDEAVVINLATGVYYSMDGPAGLIWSMAQQCCTVQDVVDAVVARYAVSREQAQADVVQLLEELRHEELIVRTAQDARPLTLPEVPEQRAYAQPRLCIYREGDDFTIKR